jgi:hypothetical protein
MIFLSPGNRRRVFFPRSTIFCIFRQFPLMDQPSIEPRSVGEACRYSKAFDTLLNVIGRWIHFEELHELNQRSETG